MPQPLSNADITQLGVFKNKQVDGLLDYYSLLEGKGYLYAGLAKGVVTGDTPAGATARKFASNVALILMLLTLYGISASTSAAMASTSEEVTAENIVRFQMGEYEYAVPATYFDTKKQQGCNNTTALMRYVLPDFAPVTDQNWREYRQVGQFGKGSGMLMRVNKGKFAGQPLKRLESRMQNYMESFAPEKLEMPFPYYGLKTFSAEVSSTTLKQEHYFNGEHVFANYDKKKQLHGFIACNVPGAVINPGCGHFFTVNDLIIKLSYRRLYLPHWEALEDKARKLIQSWTIGKAKNTLPECCEHIGCTKEQGE